MVSLTLPCRKVTRDLFRQANQPEGVPPLELTGERTLPDVPAENYWFRRHLVVYEWIAAHTQGQDLIDMACGEGYGAALLARRAHSVVGVDANPEAHEHARLRYRQPNLSFVRDMIERYGEPGSVDAISFLQTIEHVADPVSVLTHMRSLLRGGGTLYMSTPNLLTLAPPGAEKSENPFHLHEYRADEFRKLCESVFAEVRIYGIFHARKLAIHERALALGWDRAHRTLRLTKPFYDRFVPAISTRDFALRETPELDGALDFLAVCRG